MNPQTPNADSYSDSTVFPTPITVETEMSTQALPSGDDDVVVADDGTTKEPHEVLGVAEDAPDDVVKAVARRLSANVHPDQTDGDQREFKRIQEAKAAMLGGEQT